MTREEAKREILFAKREVMADSYIDKAYDMAIKALEQPEIIQCKDCKYWRQQTNFAGGLLSFGFCESDDMWQSLYGETAEVEHIDTDYNHYCGYAKRREDVNK